MLRKKAASFGYAFKGIKIGFKEESNFQMQLGVTVAVFALGLFLNISYVEWLFVIGACGLVLTAELLNTSLEELCDMLRTTHDPHVAKIKDLAAGAVLIASIVTSVIGLMIFVPKIAVLLL
jgi:diacylglycerol kinase